MATDVSKLVNYAPTSYPQIAGHEAQYFNKELANIRNAINSIEVLLKAGGLGIVTKSGLPTTSDLAAGSAGLFKDTSGGGVYLAYNDAGTIKKVQLT